MALHESLEDQPPHKRSRPPTLLDSFEQAFAPPNSSVGNNATSTVGDIQSSNLSDIRTGNTPGTTNFDNNFSPGSNALNSAQLRSPSQNSSLHDSRSTRPPSLNNQSASSSVSGLLSPFDRCLNASSLEESPKPTSSNGPCYQQMNAPFRSPVNDLYKNMQSPLQQHLQQQISPSQQLTTSLNGSIIGSYSSYIRTVKSPSSFVQTNIHSPKGLSSLQTGPAHQHQPQHIQQSIPMLNSMQTQNTSRGLIQDGSYVTVSPQSVMSQSLKISQPNYSLRAMQQIPTSFIISTCSQGTNYHLMHNYTNAGQNQIPIQNHNTPITNQYPINSVHLADPSRIRLLTAQMVLLLHAHKCSQRDKVSAQVHQSNLSIETTPCQVQQCAAMKSILNHALYCQRGDVCEVQHCVSSRKLIKHWKNCNLIDCPICSPIKAAANQYCTLNPAPLTTTRSCKEWQKCVAPEVRSNLIAKIVVSIFPNQEERHHKDKRMSSLINYARKIEAEIFDAAQNQDNYFYLLAEKVYKIRKEIDERRAEIEKSKISEQLTMPNVKQEKQDASLTSSTTNLFENHTNFRMPYNPDTTAGERGPPNKIAPSATLQQENCVKQLDSPYQHFSSRHKNSFANTADDTFTCNTAEKVNQFTEDVKINVDKSSNQSLLNTESVEDQVVVKDEPVAEVKTPVKQEPQDETMPQIEDVSDSKINTQKLEEREKINSQVLHEIFISDDSIPFRQPVDPVLLNIPDYFEIIKNPMDLSTIKRKLDDLEYESPWDLIDDMWLMFTNAWTYNKKTSKIYKMCSRLSESFVQLMNVVMKSLGYCCGEKRVYLPQVLFCYGNQLCSQIARDAQYFSFINKNPVTNMTNDKYTFCSKCFESFKEDFALVGDDPYGKLHEIAKSDFQVLRNDTQEIEPFINCKFCNRKWHQVCALYHENICTEGFVCPKCKVEKNAICRTNRFTSSRLSNNKLGQWIENRVNGLLTKSGYTSLVGKVHIRVLASFDKICEIKPRMRQHFGGQMPDRFPFRSKAIFAFQELDDRDVAFFGLHVQEYDGKAPSPNSRRVYISYLDSVYFFQPKHLRTDIYHEILIGYLDWVKRLGYNWGHIWACPPSEGDDYIFYCHPPDQKVPKQKRLIDWYRKMLDKAILDRVVIEYHDIMKDVVDNEIKTLTQIPYFDGDFWPNVFEDSIKEMEEEERRAKEESEVVKDVTSVSIALTAESEDDENMSLMSSSKRYSTQKKKNQVAKSKAQRKQQSKKLALGSDLTSKVFATMDKHKEVFFVIRLSDAPTLSTDTDDIVDSDSILPSDLMDGRDAFLNFSRERHLEFSTLRRAKYSTMAFLYEIHHQGADRFVYTCNKCKSHVEVRYHCTICDDYDLCSVCYQSITHEHPMERLAVAIDITSVAASKLGVGASVDSTVQASPQQSRQQSIERCIDSLLHAVNCRNANCSSHPGCQKMKLVIQHIKQCSNKTSNCQICRQINMLCHHHARVCTDTNCLFPFCTGLKQKMQKQRALNTQLERRRMMTTMQRSMHTVMTPPSSQNGNSREISYIPVQGQTMSSVNCSLGKPMRMPVITARSMFMQERAIQQRSLTNPHINFRRCPVPAKQIQADMSYQQCHQQDYILPTLGQTTNRVQHIYNIRPVYSDDNSQQRRTMYPSSSMSVAEIRLNSALNQQNASWQQNRIMEQQQALLMSRQQQQQQQQMYSNLIQHERLDHSIMRPVHCKDRCPLEATGFATQHQPSQFPHDISHQPQFSDDHCGQNPACGQMPHSSSTDRR